MVPPKRLTWLCWLLRLSTSKTRLYEAASTGVSVKVLWDCRQRRMWGRMGGHSAGNGGHMADDAFEATWQQLNAEVLAELSAWRRAHPHATRTEIEQAMDARLAQARARLFQQVAQDTPATDWRTAPPEQQPTCPACGVAL